MLWVTTNRITNNMKLEEAFAKRTYGGQRSIKKSVAEYALMYIDTSIIEQFHNIAEDIFEQDGAAGLELWAKELDDVCNYCNPLVQPPERIEPKFQRSVTDFIDELRNP